MNAIKIPIFDSNTREEKDRVVFYPDELPQDHHLLSDVLRAVFAPIKVWGACALEYYRQGYDDEFEQLLNEIISALDTPEISKLYSEQDKDDYTEGVIDIFVALAAKALRDFTRAQQQQQQLSTSATGSNAPEYQRKLAEYLKSLDEKQRINDYTWLIRGFFEIVQGDLNRAESHFKFVHDRATKGQANALKKYMFGALIGLGMVSYATQRYEVALGHFTKAVQTNPSASGASVRRAIACCCFKLEQYDRAKAALLKCVALDPVDANTLVLLALVEKVAARAHRGEKRQQSRSSAYEYSVLASSIEPGNAQALNLLANHHFHTWRKIAFEATTTATPLLAGSIKTDGCYIVAPEYLLVPVAAAQDCLVVRNQLRIHVQHQQQQQQQQQQQVYIVTHTIEQVYRGAPSQYATQLSPALQQLLLSGDSASAASAVAVDWSQFALVHVSPAIPAFFNDIVGGSQQQQQQAVVVACRGLEVKDLAVVERLAQEALGRTTLPAVAAESHYILGKIAHTLRNPALALDLYWKALKDVKDMSLAAFGAAQILLSRREFAPSLELFEKVLLQNPEDKDTQAYVMLLKAILKKEPAQHFDKLREVAPGFQHEVDLWLVQGQLRQADPLEHKRALRCFLNAKECMEAAAAQQQQKQQGGISASSSSPPSSDSSRTAVVPPSLLSNISVLHHSLGNLDRALEYSKLTLRAFQQSQLPRTNSDTGSSSGSSAAGEGIVFESADLDGVFYTWAKEPLCYLQPILGEAALSAAAEDEEKQEGASLLPPGQQRFRVVRAAAAADASAPTGTPEVGLLRVGDQVVIGGLLHRIERIGSSNNKSSISVADLTSEAQQLVCSCHIKLTVSGTAAAAAADGSDSPCYAMHVKESYNNFTDDTLTYCFNFARLLEDDGSTSAASEIYEALLKNHPSFMECYLRLNMISSELGKLDEASVWLSRALMVKEDEPEATLCLGDLYSYSGNLDDAKRCYEKICHGNRQDARALLSLGNFYFAYSSSAKSESQLKESYKFFYHVLNDNPHNAFAANGLGMVCARKNEIEAARETFTKAREANTSMPEDICINLAHVYALQNRIVDAERLYQTTITNLLSRSGSGGSGSSNHLHLSDKAAYLNECVAHAQHRHSRHRDAAHSMHRALHLNPTNLRFWYNAAFAQECHASSIVRDAQHHRQAEANGSKSSGGNGSGSGSSSSTSADAIEGAILSAQVAKKIFRHLSSIQQQQQQQQHHHPSSSTSSAAQKPYDRKVAAAHSSACTLKVQSLEEALGVARAREAAEEEGRQQRQQAHEATLRSKSEQREKEAQAAEAAKRLKQMQAELKSKQMEDLREKWMTAQLHHQQTKTAAAAAAGDGGGPKKRKNSKRKASGAASAVEEEEEEDGDIDEDEALMRALSEPGTGGGARAGGPLDGIDFGSSDEEGEETAVAGKRRASDRTVAVDTNRRKEDDIFADDSDEDQLAANEDEGEAAAGRERKRVKRAAAAAAAAAENSSGRADGEDEDNDMDVEDAVAAAAAASVTTGTSAVATSSTGGARKSRVIDDDDDDA